MKKSVIVLLCILLTVILFIACEKDENKVTKSVTDQIEKIETDYVEGTIKNETVFIEGIDKIETEANPELRARIEERYNKLNTKSRLKDWYNHYPAGVIRYGGCGPWETLDIYMDCEDNNNANSYSGWIGSTVINSNIKLRFCLVPGGSSYWNNIYNVSYAILHIGYPNFFTYKRHFDNEDNNNQNNMVLNGTTVPKGSNELWQNYQDNNTDLIFYVYFGGSATNFYNFGINYGVFGSFVNEYRQWGWVYIDDEDKNNANALYAYAPGIGWGRYEYNIPGIIERGSNTRLYMTRVK